MIALTLCLSVLAVLTFAPGIVADSPKKPGTHSARLRFARYPSQCRMLWVIRIW